MEARNPLEQRYIVFDVETPNYNNNRMSAIGVEIVDGGKIAEEFYTLIDPETFFSPFNISLTGISPSTVRNAPTFPEVWKKLEPIFSSGLLVAHNASFDVRVLAHCLTDYHIDWKDTAYYACTVCMGRKAYPELPNHKLDTMCRHLDIPLYHHQAQSDSRACALLLLDYMAAGFDPYKFKKKRSMLI